MFEKIAYTSFAVIGVLACSSGATPEGVPAPSATNSAAAGAPGPAPVATSLATPTTPVAAASTPVEAPAAPSALPAMTAAIPNNVPMPSSAAVDPAPTGPSGIVMDSATGELVFRTDPVQLAPGKESYTCFAATLDQDVVVDGFSKSAQHFVHHAQFVKAFVPEPAGISECNQQFKLTWLPIFLAGNGASTLRFDEGVGHVLSSGTQLVLQMHLLNTGDVATTQAVEIRMHRSASSNPTPVTPWAIGSANIRVPAKQGAQAQNVCTQNGPVDLLAVFPHMHQHGKKLKIEIGTSLDAMRPFYARDPFDFDDQHMEKMKLSLKAGDMLRVTCDYMNDTDKEVSFGESSNDEMCFFVAFALGDSPAQADCGDLWGSLLTL